ncbi:5-amino-6-(5-phospho-D-ribitylamino)uracil phosphatase YigB [Photobacterium atrarenae]|uniref:5-amino-6-(5-phospho-D-ribitylamino)uracil phosphatase YigB n=1 Tax=Photobacterium atrarenae TaxID=865757 RepID=A0ABY5GH44_9GAMM|nr:5-amino-6-(5-phospho-D-ribitylamino)uracil phosphatase YigB [Photobacterium atrarenae]UTV27673.1 5-amino-6-(5-phospho-D-ribitylamino)uracil phosphatase YigB [Photobacterium atrarenae]
MQFYRTFQPPKALTFDLDDTLYDNRPVIRRAEQAMYDWLAEVHPISHALTRKDWLRLKLKLAEYNPLLRHDVTRWRYELLKIGLMQLGYAQTQAAQAAEAGVRHVLVVRNQVDVPAETHRVLRELGKRVPMLAITNGNVDAVQIGLSPYFSRVLVAGRDGLAKPEPDLFAQAVALLGVPAADILHVGDHLVTDVGGAKLHGMQACWLNDQQRQLSREPKAKWLPDVEIHHLSQLLDLV